MGNELEFMYIETAIQKLRSDFRSRNILPGMYASRAEKQVTTTKVTGTTHNLMICSDLRPKATLPKMKHGVKKQLLLEWQNVSVNAIGIKGAQMMDYLLVSFVETCPTLRTDDF